MCRARSTPVTGALPPIRGRRHARYDQTPLPSSLERPGIGYELQALRPERLRPADRRRSSAIHDALRNSRTWAHPSRRSRPTLPHLRVSTSFMRRRRAGPSGRFSPMRVIGHAFLDQDFTQVRHVIDTNITGTIYLIQRGRSGYARSRGRARVRFHGFMARNSIARWS